MGEAGRITRTKYLACFVQTVSRNADVTGSAGEDSGGGH